jgi:ankyrin repeat protein
MLFRYVLRRFKRNIWIDRLTDPIEGFHFYPITGGYRGIFEALIDYGILTPATEIGEAKYRPLQACCFSRQRDLYFARRLLEIGCLANDIGKTDKAMWTPFQIAVKMGLYDIATLFLEHGADKDYVQGWLGGCTPVHELMNTWPDVPISRLKYMLEEIPRLGFGHVNFISWPGAGGNVMYPLAMSLWASYTSGFRLAETARYILSQIEDKSQLNKVDRIGATALRVAAAWGNVEIIQLLIEAGCDVNLGVGWTPLRNAKDWLSDCVKREMKALKEVKNNSGLGSELRLARMMRLRAEETVELLIRHGAIERRTLESTQNTRNYIMSGQGRLPSFEVRLSLILKKRLHC